MRRRAFLVGAGAAVAALGLGATACQTAGPAESRPAALALLRPEDARALERLPSVVREAYYFALERPDVLQYMPCFCGCDRTDGHISNLDCFVQSRSAQGIVLEAHGSG